jgi:hypothetical protein
MSVQFMTDDPAKLLRDFKKKIKDGDIDTWKYDDAGDFTHTPDQWIHRAWLKPAIESDRLRLNIIRSKQYDFTWAIYGVYHGRFIESMLAHCQGLFTVGRATAKPGTADADPID